MNAGICCQIWLKFRVLGTTTSLRLGRHWSWAGTPPPRPLHGRGYPAGGVTPVGRAGGHGVVLHFWKCLFCLYLSPCWTLKQLENGEYMMDKTRMQTIYLPGQGVLTATARAPRVVGVGFLALRASRAPLLLTAAVAESRRRSLPLVGVGLLALQASRAPLLQTAAVAEAGWGRGAAASCWYTRTTTADSSSSQPLTALPVHRYAICYPHCVVSVNFVVRWDFIRACAAPARYLLSAFASHRCSYLLCASLACSSLSDEE